MIFMATISCNIQYITIDPLENKTKSHIIKTLNKIKKSTVLNSSSSLTFMLITNSIVMILKLQ